MDRSPVVSMDALWPELAEQRRPFEVVVTIPRTDGGEPLVPCQLPAAVLGCWSADQVVLSVTVLASRPSAAVAVAEVLVPELAGAAGAVVTAPASWHFGGLTSRARALIHPEVSLACCLPEVLAGFGSAVLR